MESSPTTQSSLSLESSEMVCIRFLARNELPLTLHAVVVFTIMPSYYDRYGCGCEY